MKTSFFGLLGLRSISVACTALGIIGFVAMLPSAAFAETVQAQAIKSAFIPMAPDKEMASGSYGQAHEGGFICYGTVEKVRPAIAIADVEYQCKGEKTTVEKHVKTKMGGTYFGATFLYQNPTLVGTRGGYTIGGSRPGISGLIIYYQ